MPPFQSGCAPLRAAMLAIAAATALLLAGCSALPDRPERPVLYDFGPGERSAVPAAAPGTPRLQPIALADIDTNAIYDGNAVLYRLAYADAQELRPYAQARWSTAPGQLVQQRLRDVLGRDRAVLNAGEGAAVNRRDGALPMVLQIELEEFTHIFESPAQSVGLVRLRATLLANTTREGDRLLGQRMIVAQAPAPSADASGGVRALGAATDQAVAEIAQWLKEFR